MRLAMAVLLASTLAGCGPAEPVAVAPAGSAPVGEAAAKGGNVDVAGLKADLEKGHVPLLVDVRETYEYGGGHIPSAVNIPLGELEGRLAELEPHRDQKVYVVCESGRRSLAAKDVLDKRGFDVVNVEGGTRAWRSAGYATE
jgi:rhodanese-related sulfurtransferase